MNWVSGAALTAAVSAAGGMGTLGPNAGAEKVNPDVEATGELARRQIHKVRSLTDKPFAVNVTVGVGEGMKYSKKIVEVVNL
jgi:enoyl-[acyl-carrier protein] reductase II